MSKEDLKRKFSTGAKPTGEDFANLIDEIFSKLTPLELETTKDALVNIIGQKADEVDLESATDAIEALSLELGSFLTEEDLEILLEGYVEKDDVYTKEEVSVEIESSVAELREEISILKDDIALIKQSIGESGDSTEEPDTEEGE